MNIYLRIKGRDAVDEKYAQALQKEKNLSYEDSLNALYVAFTRARENLFVVARSKDSMFDILDIKPLTSGVLRCKKENETLKKEQTSKEPEYKDLYYGTQSDILEAEQEHQEDIKSINFGLAMHYMLEMLADFEHKHILDAKYMMINKYGYILDDEEIEDILNRVDMLIKNEEFGALAKGECFRERPLRYKNNLLYIDLLVKDASSWNVIDYKSSYNYHQEHIKQVKNYVKALKEITGERAEGYICYLLNESIKIVKV